MISFQLILVLQMIILAYFEIYYPSNSKFGIFDGWYFLKYKDIYTSCILKVDVSVCILSFRESIEIFIKGNFLILI